MINNCDIVEDLIPMYVEDLTSEGSNQFIKEHLKSCENCSGYLENMERNLPKGDSLDTNDEKEDKKLIKDIKHKIYRMKFFSVLIGVLIGLSISLKFFPIALVGLVSFILIIVLLVYLLRNNERHKNQRRNKDDW